MLKGFSTSFNFVVILVLWMGGVFWGFFFQLHFPEHKEIWGMVLLYYYIWETLEFQITIFLHGSLSITNLVQNLFIYFVL